MSDYINIKYYIHTYIYIYISRSAHLPSPEILVNPLPRQNSTFQPHALGHGEQLGNDSAGNTTGNWWLVG